MKSDMTCEIKVMINNTILSTNLYADVITFVKCLSNILINVL